jgi:hypothetical protein
VAPDVFGWRSEAYEFVSDRPAIDLLTGDVALRQIVDDGLDPGEWVATWAGDGQRFRAEREAILLYD